MKNSEGLNRYCVIYHLWYGVENEYYRSQTTVYAEDPDVAYDRAKRKIGHDLHVWDWSKIVIEAVLEDKE